MCDASVLHCKIELGCDTPSVQFDASAPGAAQRECLLSIGWPEGRLPTTSTLVGHILDRLEYACARDVAVARLVISRGIAIDTLPSHGVALFGGYEAVLHALLRSGDRRASRRVAFGDADDYLSCENPRARPSLVTQPKLGRARNMYVSGS